MAVGRVWVWRSPVPRLRLFPCGYRCFRGAGCLPSFGGFPVGYFMVNV